MVGPQVNVETDRLNKIIKENAMSKEDIILEYIERHQADVMKYQEGVDYYFKKNDIIHREIEVYDNNGNKTTDRDATNNKMASGWHKLLVDQKVAYLAGEPITVNSKEDDGEAIELINNILGDQFNDIVPELVKCAANKGREWLHPFIDEDGMFDYIIVHAQEGIPIYDNTKRRDLIGFIRTYELDDGTEKVELWDEEYVTYYEYHDGKLVLDMSHENNPDSHFYYGEKGYGWKKVPFIEFMNNEERVSDLVFIKDYIDVYDLLTADGANTLEDIQQFLYVIKGYTGTDVSQAVTNFKRYKGVSVDQDGGGVDIVQGSIPMESLDSMLDRIVGNIYQFGQGVNIDTDKFGNSPSGIALKFLFSLLDMKASVSERKFTRALELFMWFICEYIAIVDNKEIDYKTITFTFNTSMLMNELEQADIAQKSKGIISDETITEYHPWVTDVQVEKERMEKERKERETNIDLDDEVDGNEADENEGDNDVETE